MTKLSDTQLVILSAAAQREDRNALPLPANLRGGAATKVVTALLRKGLIDEVEADPRMDEALWRETGDGHGTTLIATEAGLAAIGIEPGDANSAPAGDDAASSAEPPDNTSAEAQPAPKTRTPRTGTKHEEVIAMLSSDGGATIDDIVAPTGWKSHYADPRIMPM